MKERIQIEVTSTMPPARENEVTIMKERASPIQLFQYIDIHLHKFHPKDTTTLNRSNPLNSKSKVAIMNLAVGETEQRRRQNPYSRLPDWFYPTNVVLWLGLFSLYALIVSFGDFKLAAFGPYLSPFTSPAIEGHILP
ncbi:MAG: hypothetical protein ACREP9_04745, partial [Candidatus Dormibacteraceae bacterium]